MSYDLHITRAKNWVRDRINPVTLSEILEKHNPLPAGFSVEEFPGDDSGEEFLVYESDNGEASYIYFREKRAPIMPCRNPYAIFAVIKLAESLGAKVQGDDGEFYVIKNGKVETVDNE